MISDDESEDVTQHIHRIIRVTACESKSNVIHHLSIYIPQYPTYREM